MHVGTGVIFQSELEGRTDRDVYQNELRLADLAEPLGFESLWGVEHHFTGHAVCPDVLQYLTYMAGRTRRIRLGSMVVVLPWHHPMRVAEQVAMLDTMSNGRFIFGMGRGLGRIEFEGLGVRQEESRGSFNEAAEMILTGLERGYCEFDGKFIKQAKRDIRPRPFKTFRGRTYAAAVSPESARILAKLGIGMVIMPQKPWDTVAIELEEYRRVFREVNAAEAPPPLVVGWVVCDDDVERAKTHAREYIGGYWRSLVQHYELVGDHLSKIKGYESYDKLQGMMSAPRGIDSMSEFFVGLNPWGTPDQCYEKIIDIQTRTGAEGFMGVFSIAGMPYDAAERSLRLFAAKVMPRLKQRIPLAQQRIARPTP
ncbi:LLM class flavin-dependent oxidoreductase [Pendulispora rubella]|uniref:LLM class flavin-dependent oxidoreductase n=1 Tax=Pendulispora rubella TaxID=2741070 RepID=A0ABZ2LBQ6_9BACT